MEKQEVAQVIRRRLEEEVKRREKSSTIEYHSERARFNERSRDSYSRDENGRMDAVLGGIILSHNQLVSTVNWVYRNLCEEFGVPYQEIKSQINTL